MLSVGDYILIRQKTCDSWEIVQIIKFWPNGYVSVRWVDEKRCARGVILIGQNILNF